METFAQWILCIFLSSITELINCTEYSNLKEVTEFSAARQLYVYREYKDVQIIHFSMPSHVLQATYNMTSNSSYSCGVRNISVYLQGHSFPVVTPDDVDMMPYMWKNRQKLFETTLLSDLKPVLLTVSAPYAGDWFMIGYINDESKRIRQQGLFPSCYAWLQVEATYLIDPNIRILQATNELNNNSILSEEKISSRTFFRFFLSDYVWSAYVIIDYCRSEFTLECEVELRVRPGGLPLPEIENTRELYCNFSEKCQLSFVPFENDWQYIEVNPRNDSVLVGIHVEYKACSDDSFSDYQTSSNLTAQFIKFLDVNSAVNEITLGNIMAPEYYNEIADGKTADVLGNSSLFPIFNGSLDDTGNTSELFDFSFINESSFLLDSSFNTDSKICWKRHDLRRRTYPGNFAFEYDLQPNENGTVPLILNITNYEPSILTFKLQAITDIGGTLSIELAISPFMNTTMHNYSVVGCLSIRTRSNFYVSDNGTLLCENGWPLSCNTSHPMHLADMVMVPYPEPVPWVLSLISVCFLTNSSEVTPCTSNVTSILFSVNSASCIHGKCGRYGSCFQYISGGFIFSTCSCTAGYRGWGCRDGTEALPNWKLLLSTLLLTLSNLLFLPAIILAIYRLYLTEAVVYFLTMFFSTFYHACDQSVYKYCLMPLTVLQFGDFYCAIMSFWVTLIAMAKLTQRTYSILHMVGALIVALGCEYNRTGLWVFAAPSIAAIFIMSSAWANQCRKKKTCHPPRQYWLYSLLPGTVLATVGLICYAFFETEDNYYLIHSFWHSIMALSILCLLPPKAHKGTISYGLNSEEPDPATSDVEAITINAT